MKKVIIIGASGSLAAYVTDELHKQSDVHLTLFLRNKNKIKLPENEGSTVIEGDVLDYAFTRKGEPEQGTAISRNSIATFIATIIENPELHKNENLGISKPE